MSSPNDEPLWWRPSPDQWRELGWRTLGFGIVLGIVLAVLPSTAPPPEQARALTAGVGVRAMASPIDAGLATWIERHRPEAPAEHALELGLEWSGPEGAREAVARTLGGLERARLTPGAGADGVLLVEAHPRGDEIALQATLRPVRGDPVELATASPRVGAWTSVLPPLLAVLVALFFKRLLVALVAAVWLGAALQVGFWPWPATREMVATYLVGSTFKSFNLYVIGFTLSLVGMVHVLLRMGGMAGLLERIGRLATSARATRLTCALMGGAIFFDDYANTIVVGSTMRPVTDARRISREKLAYLVDSTSAPIAGVAIISTWIGYEVGLFEELSTQLGLGKSGYEIFFAILGMRFYCLLTLGFVLMNAWSGRDFGPMLAAERRAARGQPQRPGAAPLTQVELEHLRPVEGIPHRWYNAVIPVALVIASVLGGMYWSGWSHQGAWLPGAWALLTGAQARAQLGAHLGEALGQLGSFEVWRAAFSGADNAKVLFWSSMLGSLCAVGLAVGQRLLTLRQAVVSWARAIPGMRMAVAILVLAWAIQGVCGDLNTSVYLVGVIQGWVTVAALPLLTFLLAAGIAFATGTSWGTMGILLPALIPLAHHMTRGAPGGEVVLLLCFAAVLDGAIFGDHCSPISDTTVMSSIASACDHLDHVRTQVPYALTTMLAAAGLGYVGVAQGLDPTLALMGGLAGCALALALLGRAHEPASPGRPQEEE